MDDSGQSLRHVAIVMDGNGRWAKKRGLPRTLGHRRGVEAVRTTIKAAIELKIKYLTLFGFSSENWKRPPDEVSELMGLLRIYLRSEIAELHKSGVRLRIIGDREKLDSDIVKMIAESENLTAANDTLHLTIALSYGGRAEIVAACQDLAQDLAKGKIELADITEEAMDVRLYTKEIPDPDLLIRTSGEKRISNFLLWQMAYAEFWFTEVLWPDFSKKELEAALDEFHKRERRFGALVG